MDNLSARNRSSFSLAYHSKGIPIHLHRGCTSGVIGTRAWRLTAAQHYRVEALNAVVRTAGSKLMQHFCEHLATVRLQHDQAPTAQHI